MHYLIGRTGFSFLDPWSIVHLSTWIVVGANLRALHAPRWWSIVGCLAGALLWEVFERYAERTWPQVWLHPESWWNAWVSDQLMCVLGVLGIWIIFDRWS